MRMIRSEDILVLKRCCCEKLLTLLIDLIQLPALADNNDGEGKS